MLRLNNFFVPVLAGASALALCFSSCSSDSSSGSEDAGDSIVSLEDGQNLYGSSSSEEGEGGNTTDPDSGKADDKKPGDGKSSTSPSGDDSKPTPKSASTAEWQPVTEPVTETVSSEEELAEANKVVKGSCAPTTAEIEKGGMATWAFFRSAGDVFDQIMAPFVWTFDDGKVLKGNGLDKVNKTYETSGIYKATLKVDGNDVECDPLRVQGIPITVTSCKAAKNSVNAGETISWTVEAESEAEITGYSWKSNDAEVSGSGTSATMVATGEMHKKTVNAIVSVTNSDKTVQEYTCESVSVVDPDQVDVVIAHSKADESKAFTSGQTLVAQYPSNAVNCQLICSAEGNGIILEIDGKEYTINYSENITPAACKDGSAAGTKLTVKASMQVLCYVAY
ncbi:MAG: hypothetical protein II892_03280 [Fibrobacter sp.]|nr:hypothetical protein [Fibrobacter sp.]